MKGSHRIIVESRKVKYDFVIHRNITGITGDSGSGKSTLIKLIMKELNPTEGTIIVNGQNLNRMKHRNIAKYRRGLGVVFQDFRLLKDKTVYENVAFAQRVIGESSRTIRESVPQMLKMVGLSSKYKFFPHQLSGGEQQRVAIARALINRPEILLACSYGPHGAWSQEKQRRGA